MIRKLKILLAEFIHERILYVPVQSLISKVVIVTGATHGLGKALVQTLSGKGCTVIAVSRHKKDLDALYMGQLHVYCIAGDVTKEMDVSRIVSETLHAFGRIDVLINNVGKYVEKPLETISLKDYEDIVQTNQQSLFLMTKAVIPSMKSRKDGYIISIGSKISHNTKMEKHTVLYAMTKYAVEGFSFALNRELKPWNIRVSCLMPGTMRTYLSRHSKTYLSPRSLAEYIAAMMEMTEIDFESVVLKSRHHDL